MSRINRLPLGLLDFLATKSQGDNPSELLREVRPTLDLTEFFAAERLELESRTVQVPAAGFLNEIFTVPVGEVWRVYRLHVEVLFALANEDVQMEIRMENPVGGSTSAFNRTTLIGDNAIFTSPVNSFPYFTVFDFPSPILVGTDTQFHFLERTANFVAANTTHSMAILLQRYKT